MTPPGLSQLARNDPPGRRNGGVQYIQIDTGYIGGIAPAFRVAKFAKNHGVQFVNHTFTSHSALAVSMQPYAGMKESYLVEYPMEPKLLCVALKDSKILPDKDGMIFVPEQPGVGVSFSPSAISKYLVDVEIVVNTKTLYRTPVIKDYIRIHKKLFRIKED